MSSSQRTLCVGLLGVVGALFGCGGSNLGDAASPVADGGIDAASDATVGNDAGSTRDSGGGDAGADVATTPSSCPATAPAEGDPCTTARLTCEFGASNDPFCNVTFQCNGQQWVKAYDGSGCRYSGSNDATCPATFDQASQGDSCSNPVTCEYPEGRCECILSCGGPPPVDAGVPGFFQCVQVRSSCPVPRGNNKLGTACQTPGQHCTYRLCCGSASQTCNESGIWEGTIDVRACP